MKTCRICGVALPLTKFSRHPNTKDGYNPTCKACNGRECRLAELARRDEAVRLEREAVLRARRIARFWRSVNQHADRGCWQWIGWTRNGYGRVQWDGRVVTAHRLAYELTIGPIPEGLTLDHLCRNRGCVNPAHLEPVPMRVNALRGIGPTAINAQKTHCPKGHPYTPENTKRGKHGGRWCRTCKNEAARMARRQKKQRKR